MGLSQGIWITKEKSICLRQICSYGVFWFARFDILLVSIPIFSKSSSPRELTCQVRFSCNNQVMSYLKYTGINIIQCAKKHVRYPGASLFSDQGSGFYSSLDQWARDE